MKTTRSRLLIRAPKKEGYTLAAFIRGERYMNQFREALMKKAGKIARSESPRREPGYAVTKEHLDQAMHELLCQNCLKLFIK
jgi:hypothetical protein